MDYDIQEILSYIDCSRLSYQEWTNVGMILKSEGFDVSVWDDWSRNDTRYRVGECDRKWGSFNGSSMGSNVGIGSLIHMAKSYGYSPVKHTEERFFAFDDVIMIDEPPKYMDVKYISPGSLVLPDAKTWKPCEENRRYLEALFEPDEYVGYVLEANGKNPIGKGIYTRTAGQLIDKLKKTNDITNAYGSYTKESGAWIHINPLDGEGVTDANVTAYRFCLIESDEAGNTLEEQYAQLKATNLPIAALTWSGGKSLHAVVRVDAKSMTEYQAKVNYIYDALAKNGIKVDQQTRNPSRLTRMPGFMRGSERQWLVDTNIGAKTFQEWKDGITRKASNLPPIKKLSDIWENPPAVNEPLIDGLLRRKHKMLISAASKAGKSFSLIELSICLAEGIEWLGFKCHQGKILHIDFELDEASLIKRIMEVYRHLGIAEPSENFRYWSLKGKAKPLDKLVEDIVRECKDEQYAAIIIDPLYKVMTGDENSATDMGAFCNQFDILTTQLNASVIFSHHHSKGAQAAKRAQDRASGSGVFARDPDALIDMTELDVDEEVYGKIRAEFTPKCADAATGVQFAEGERAVEEYRDMRAFRLEFVLREFKTPKPLNIWFNYPYHFIDEHGFLDEADIYDPALKAAKSVRKRSEEHRASTPELLVNAFNEAKLRYPDADITYRTFEEILGKPVNTLKDWFDIAEKSEDFPLKRVHHGAGKKLTIEPKEELEND